MPRPGPKPKSADVIDMRGTKQACRGREQVVDGIEAEIVRPEWLPGDAAAIWDAKMAVFTARGQNIAGCEMALAQYCACEAELIRLYREPNLRPTQAMVREHRMWAAEFHDTPASQIGQKGAKPTGNRFERNGKRP